MLQNVPAEWKGTKMRWLFLSMSVLLSYPYNLKNENDYVAQFKVKSNNL